MSKKVTMYKLVSQQMTTHGGMSWEIGKTNRAIGVGTMMCTAQVLHCYRSPEEAVLFNPVHANIKNPILLEIDCSEIVNSDGLKYASKEQTPKSVQPLPKFTLNQTVAFAIKLAMQVYKNKDFIKWALGWLDGSDRSAAIAAANANAAIAASYAANAAYAASYAAYAAYYAANAASYAANAASYAANAASYAAYAASYAANAADFGELVRVTIDWVINSFEE